MLIAIDGYNFIKQSPELRKLEQIELQKAREGLIEDLARYKRVKGHSILVVLLDGGQQGGGGKRRKLQGIQVVFSRPGEKADDVLQRLAAEKEGWHPPGDVRPGDRRLCRKERSKGIARLGFCGKNGNGRVFCREGIRGRGQVPGSGDRPGKERTVPPALKVPAENDLRRQKTIGVRQPGCRDKRAERRNHPGGAQETQCKVMNARPIFRHP